MEELCSGKGKDAWLNGYVLSDSFLRFVDKKGNPFYNSFQIISRQK